MESLFIFGGIKLTVTKKPVETKLVTGCVVTKVQNPMTLQNDGSILAPSLWKGEPLITHHHSEHGEQSACPIKLSIVFKSTWVGVTQM